LRGGVQARDEASCSQFVKQRLGRSPDRSDALACTFGLAEMPAGMVTARGSVGHYETNRDPFAETPRRSY
jgi:hypothetical protein